MTKIQVSAADTARLLNLYRPGQVVPSTIVFRDYVRLMDADDRPIANRVALGRALTRAGCARTVVRRARGPRGDQKFTDTHCWLVPGAPPVYEDDDRMGAVLRKLIGPTAVHAIIPKDEIWRAYAEMARDEGWRDSFAQAEVGRWMSKRGFPSTSFKAEGRPAKPGRYVDRARLDRVAPPRDSAVSTGQDG